VDIPSLRTALLTAALLCAPARAEAPRDIAFEGGVTATLQGAANGSVSTEAQGSLDLVTLVPLGPGDLTLYLEGGTTQSQEGLAAWIPEANGDAGSAVDRDDKGRLQISELFYSLPVRGFQLSLGLMDATGVLDSSLVAGDETTQFLAGPLVHNTTIEFPDYTLGLALSSEPGDRGLGFNLFLGGSQGLGDNEDRGYSELFDLGADGKGVFAAAEGVWSAGVLTGELGIWFSSAEHERLDGNGDEANNYGLYGLLDGPAGDGAWNLRAGWADPDLSEAAWFLGAVLEYPLGPATAGFGIAHTGVSGHAGPDRGHNSVAEVYARFDVSEHLQITPSLQYVRNPGFVDTGRELDRDQWLVGLRVNLPF
jgi:hypothetical protein